MSDERDVSVAVVLACGDGERAPIDRLSPPSMWPVMGADGVARPALHGAIEEAVSAGIEDVVVVCRAGDADRLRSYFWPMSGAEIEACAGDAARLAEGERLAELGRMVRFIEQPTARGAGAGLLLARRVVGERPVLVLRGDRVYESFESRSCAAQLVGGWSGGHVSAVGFVSGDDLPSARIIRGAPMAGSDGVFAVDTIVDGPDRAVAERELRSPGAPLGSFLAELGLHVFDTGVFAGCEQADGRCSFDDLQRGLMGGSYTARLVSGRSGGPFGAVGGRTRPELRIAA